MWFELPCVSRVVKTSLLKLSAGSMLEFYFVLQQKQKIVHFCSNSPFNPTVFMSYCTMDVTETCTLDFRPALVHNANDWIVRVTHGYLVPACHGV